MNARCAADNRKKTSLDVHRRSVCVLSALLLCIVCTCRRAERSDVDAHHRRLPDRAGRPRARSTTRASDVRRSRSATSSASSPDAASSQLDRSAPPPARRGERPAKFMLHLPAATSVGGEPVASRATSSSGTTPRVGELSRPAVAARRRSTKPRHSRARRRGDSAPKTSSRSPTATPSAGSSRASPTAQISVKTARRDDADARAAGSVASIQFAATPAPRQTPAAAAGKALPRPPRRRLVVIAGVAQSARHGRHARARPRRRKPSAPARSPASPASSRSTAR